MTEHEAWRQHIIQKLNFMVAGAIFIQTPWGGLTTSQEEFLTWTLRATTMNELVWLNFFISNARCYDVPN